MCFILWNGMYFFGVVIGVFDGKRDIKMFIRFVCFWNNVFVLYKENIVWEIEKILLL